MFQDLDATLAALLEAELEVENVSVSFAAPDDQFPPSTAPPPAVSFFLYDVRENHELRTNQWEIGKVRAGGGNGDSITVASRRRPPVRVDCSYLITAWPSESAPDPAGDEHHLLGEVMRVLLRHRAIPTQYLQRSLVDQEPPLRAKILAENQLQSLGELWQAMGGRPKAALHYGITISVDVSTPEDLGRVVTTKTIDIHQGVAGSEKTI